MMQKEVAKRIASSNGSKNWGILSVLLQTYSTIEYQFDVGRDNFNPSPKVDSAVLKFNFLKSVTDVEDLDFFKKTVKGIFNYRRKMLRNSLGRIFDAEIVNSLDDDILTKRPEQLTLADFKNLSNTINQFIKKNSNI